MVGCVIIIAGTGQKNIKSDEHFSVSLLITESRVPKAALEIHHKQFQFVYICSGDPQNGLGRVDGKGLTS